MADLNLKSYAENREISELEMHSVTGGVFPYYAAINMFVTALDTHGLNPQPLPPMPQLVGLGSH